MVFYDLCQFRLSSGKPTVELFVTNLTEITDFDLHLLRNQSCTDLDVGRGVVLTNLFAIGA